MPYTPFHREQIEQSLPQWSKQLHPDHASRIVQSLRKEYLDADGVPYPWFSNADTLMQEGIQRAIALRDKSRSALQTALSNLKSISDYCAPLLQAQLKLDIPVSQALYVHQPVEIKHPVGVPVGLPPPTELGTVVAKGAPRYLSLLEAALHNFEGPNDTTRLSRLQRSREDTLPISGLPLAEFISRCRELDLGKRYQDHLNEVFAGPQASHTRALAVAARRDEFRVQTRIARCKKLIDVDVWAALHAMAADIADAPLYKERPLRCWQLTLFGIPIHEMLFIAPADTRKHDPVVLYDPANDGQIRQFASLAEVYSHLHEQLLQTDYRKRFVGLALQRQQAELNQRLKRALFSNPQEADANALQPRDSTHLDPGEHARSSRPWAELESDHLTRLRADARSIAIPTADVDARVRERNLEYWLDLGFNVLNVAAMFVPGLNTLMLAVGAAQIMDSVFEGISAWEEGDNQQALAQLESILINIGVVAAVGAGAAALKASGFVDEMQSIVKDGKNLLWRAGLEDYASEVKIPDDIEADAQGRYTLNGRHFIRLDGTLYEQQQEHGRWHIAHPRDPQAYRPPLLDNGEGAWRGLHESPVEWDQRLLLRRLGPIGAGLEEHELQAALKCSGESEETLRYAQVAGQRPPALLADLLDRLRSERQVDDLVQRVRDQSPLYAHRNFALPSLTELEGWPQEYAIRAYNGPENWGPSTLYSTTAEDAVTQEVHINRRELDAGVLASRIVAQLDERSLAQLLPAGTGAAEQSQALSTKLALYLEQRRSTLRERFYTHEQLPLSEPAQVLASQFQGLPRRAVEEIMAHTDAHERARLSSGRVPLRIAEEARALQARARLNKALLGMYRPALANTDSTVLDTAMVSEHPAADASQRLEYAAADRPLAARLIGQQPIRPGYRSPMRLAHGRIGYSLSGRLSWLSPAHRRLQALYPSLDSSQRNAMLRQLRQRGDIGQQLGALERERNLLDSTLRQWEEQGTENQRDGRTEVRELINAAWRRDDPDSLTLEALDVEALPSLPARFDHITTLSIRRIGIRRIPTEFFQSFPALRTLRLVQCPELDFEGLFGALAFTPNLEVLELGNNALGRLTTGMRQRLGALPRLLTLNLRHNALRLAADDLQALAPLRLEALDLEDNAIILDTPLASGFTHLNTLRDLRLSNNPLHTPPDVTRLVQLRNLQLRNCALQTWPPGLTQLMLQDAPQLRHLNLSSNSINQIEALDQILASPFAETLRTARNRSYWEFNDNDIDAASVQRLRATGVQIDIDSDVSDIADHPWLQGANDEERRLWQDLFEENENRHLRDVVERAGSSDQALRGRDRMARQVWQLLEQARQDQALRKHLNTVAQDYPPTCEDAGADAFSALQLEAQTFKVLAEEAPRPYFLFNYFRKLYRREMVNALGERIQLARLARQAPLTRERLAVDNQHDTQPLPALDLLDDLDDEALLRGGTDLIEIRLALRQSLYRYLEFPEASEGMLYRDLAMISSNVESNVEQAVRMLDDTAAERRGWIARQPIWQRYLMQRFGNRFETLDERWYLGLQYLDYCLDAESEAVTSLDDAVFQALREALPGASLGANGTLQRVDLSSALYQQASRQLQSGRDLQREALFEQLTGEQDRNNR
ncbi:dermonecrotic toxin domain-containing protein [Pseudomonas sp. NPDC089996]|uniref:dermonecrotic toxin domain-containing protein n=1 Tax=Pseudomonas sp. NPDC089996 TaxID=3364474 RepID=UPI00381F68B1